MEKNLKEYIEERVENLQYWIVTSKPKTANEEDSWNFLELKSGNSVTYSMRDKKGKFRNNYNNIKLGDIVLNYESSPTKAILGLSIVSKIDKSKEEISFTKITQFDRIKTISFNYLKEIKINGSAEKFVKSFNKQSKEAFDAILEKGNIKTEDINILIGANVLVYGVPGCGKSHYIKSKYKNITNENSERVVFHPDYTYSDFVGQILPKIKSVDGKETIEYAFVEGPFTRLLKKCEENREEMYYLVIEEINRGNAPAIFGEIFQLLDRNDSGKSEYGINNSDIAKKVYNDENEKVKIPNNLTILATMNTADQNVFTLDTAFKRRWEMKSIPNNFKEKADDEFFNSHLKQELCDSNIKWNDFATTINKKIIEKNESNLGSEDKRLGHFFLKTSELKDVEKFSEKIIMYLWNDVFKFDRSEVFDSQYQTLEDVLDKFKEKKFDIFNKDLGFGNKNNSSKETDSSDGGDEN